MPLVKRFIAFEKGQIVTLSSLSLNSRTVAKKTERSKAVLINFLNLNDNYGKGNFWCRPEALSSWEERTVLRLTSTGK